MFAALGEAWPTFHGFVHSIGFAPKEAIAGDFLEGLSREAFRIAHDISSYSFPAMAKAAAGRLEPGSALLTLTYLGALRSVPNYNTMGLAKASLEASVRYLAAEPRPEGRPRQRHLGRADQDARRVGHQGLRQDPRRRRRERAAAPQRHDRRRRQRRRVPALRPRRRRHVGDRLRRRRLQPRDAGRGVAAPQSGPERGPPLPLGGRGAWGGSSPVHAKRAG